MLYMYEYLIKMLIMFLGMNHTKDVEDEIIFGDVIDQVKENIEAFSSQERIQLMEIYLKLGEIIKQMRKS